MSYSLGPSVSIAGTGTTSPIDTTGMDLLVAVVTNQSAASTPTDSYSNFWQSPGSPLAVPFSGETQTYFVENPTVGAGHDFTNSGTVGSLIVGAFSGAKLSGILDQYSANQTGSPAQAGSITPTENDELVIFTAGGFWTTFSTISGVNPLDEIPGVGGVNFSTLMGYSIQGSASAINPTMTNASISGFVGVMLTSFKSAGGVTPSGMRRNSSLNGLSVFGKFFADPLAKNIHSMYNKSLRIHKPTNREVSLTNRKAA